MFVSITIHTSILNTNVHIQHVIICLHTMNDPGCSMNRPQYGSESDFNYMEYGSEYPYPDQEHS